ncbi:TPA: glycosyltransferase [Streptococcus suis]|nr:glycosyltransferase [Streptococcus suis]
MKIVFLSFLHGFGGAEKQNIALANEMAERGHSVWLVSLSVDNVCYELSTKVKYIYLKDTAKGVGRLLARYSAIKEFLSEIKPDITIHFWFQTAYLTSFMSKKVTGKIIYAERGDPGDKEYKGIMGLIRMISIPRIDYFIFQSKGAQEFFNQKVQRKSKIIMNPIFINDLEFPELICRRKVIVSVGRLHEQKNQKLLIMAFADISEQLEGYDLEIYGEGPLENELRILIQRLNLSKRIFLKGTCSEIHKKMIDASLFVLSSDYEGVPNTLLEAMALGLPVISTDCRPGGARYVINNKENGLLVPRNDKTALSNSMLWMLRNPQIAEKMGKSANNSVKEFSSEKIYDQWEECLRRIK